MIKKSVSATAAIFAMVLMLSIGVNVAQASERIMDKGKKANAGITEKDAMIRDAEMLIRTGRMIVEEGKKTKDKTMIENGQLMIEQGQKMKAGK